MLRYPSSWRKIRPHRWPTVPPRPCHQAAGPENPVSHHPGSARPVKHPLGVLRPRHQPQVLLVPPAQARWQEVGATTKHLNRLRRKNLLQLDLALRRLMRNLHRHHRVDPSIQTVRRERRFSGRKAGSSTVQGPDRLTVLLLRHIGEHCLTFLTEHFNISIVGVDIPSIWKNSVIIPILKAEKPRDQGRSYWPISLLCMAVKSLERLLLPSIV